MTALGYSQVGLVQKYLNLICFQEFKENTFEMLFNRSLMALHRQIHKENWNSPNCYIH